jgi:hypothetical protein
MNQGREQENSDCPENKSFSLCSPLIREVRRVRGGSKRILILLRIKVSPCIPPLIRGVRGVIPGTFEHWF